MGIILKTDNFKICDPVALSFIYILIGFSVLMTINTDKSLNTRSTAWLESTKELCNRSMLHMQHMYKVLNS